MKIPFMNKKKQVKEEKTRENEEDIFKNVSSIHDLFAPDGLIENTTTLELGADTVARVYRIETYPPEINIGWLDDVFSLGNVEISVHLHTSSSSAVTRSLTKKIASLKAQYNIDVKRGEELKLPEMEQAISDLESVRRAVQTNRDKLFYCTVFLVLYAESYESLEERAGDLVDLLNGKSAYPRALFLRQLDGLKSSIPIGNCVVSDKWHNLTTGGVASMMPVNSPNLSHSSGVLLGRNRFSGAPVFYDSFLGPPRLPNPHMFVCGVTGSGKSFFLDLFTLRSQVLGVRTAIIDPEREHVEIVNQIGGTVISISAGKPSGINPLDLEIEKDSNNRECIDLVGKVTEIKWLLNVMLTGHGGRKLSASELSIVEEAAREIYTDREITEDPASLYEMPEGGRISEAQFAAGKTRKSLPTLTDLIEKIGSKSGGEELAQILKPFTAGGTLSMFDGEATVDVSNAPAICFDIKNISDEFMRLYSMYVILSWVWWKFALRRDSTKKRLIVDEAWRFMKHVDSIQFLEEIARRGRKHGISLTIASQTFDEFTATEEGKAVLWSCATMNLFQPHPNQMDSITDEFGLSEGCQEFLDSASPGECLFMVNRSVAAIAVEPTPYEFRLIEEGKEKTVG